MRIEKLEVKGFGKLENLNLELGRGLNIIFGKNESGKTSLQWFIKGMFFGLKGGRISKDGALPPLKRYKPWNASDFSGFLEYRLDSGELFRIERNYSTNSVKVFDAYFNDITGSFEQSRERGAHFAEKHLGVSEVCFDKTVFIRQMESRIGEDGLGELINRLINVGQTGFEDISFNRAKEALKEALKQHVGTDKTTTRPLDKVNARLDELQALRLEITKKRESLFEVEEELKTLTKKKNMLEKRREDLVRLREAANISEAVLKNRKLKEELDSILKSINVDEAALESAEAKLKAAEKDREKLCRFSSFSIDDSDRMDFEYGRLESLREDKRRIENETAGKRNDLSSIELQLEKLKAFNYMDENVEKRAMELSREIENLRKDLGKIDQDAVNERLSNARKREHRYIYMTAAAAALTVIMAAIGITGAYAGYAAALAALAAAFVFYAKKHKETGMLNELLSEKKFGFVNISSINEEIGKKREALEEMYRMVGAAGIEEFLMMKEKYNGLVRQIEVLNNDIERLEGDLEENGRKAAVLEKSIASVFHKAGIAENIEAEVSGDMVKEFKYGVRNYKELEMAIIYTRQRINDLKDNLDRHFGSACTVSGIPLSSRKELTEIIDCICQKTAALEEQLNNTGISSEIPITEGSFHAGDIYGSEKERVDEEIKGVLLRIRERETLLKSAGDDDELQRVIEEIDALHERKSELEDIDASLKTALEVLTEASAELQRDFMPFLNSKMSSIICKISCGRYKDLRADDNLMLKAIAPETGDVVAVPALSGGTVDQMYLALRIAMADLIGSTGEKLPFVMDEVLAQYDDERIRETLEFLYELSEERQIILFTCKEREIDVASEVCGTGINVIRLE